MAYTTPKPTVTARKATEHRRPATGTPRPRTASGADRFHSASATDPATFDTRREELERVLHQRFGVKIHARVVGPGALDDDTELHTSPKPKRFRDER